MLSSLSSRTAGKFTKRLRDSVTNQLIINSERM